MLQSEISALNAKCSRLESIAARPVSNPVPFSPPATLSSSDGTCSNHVPASFSNLITNSVPSSLPATFSSSDSSCLNYVPASSSNQFSNVKPRLQPSVVAGSEDRKLNVIVYGIPECKQGLHYKQRFTSDLNSVSSLFGQSDLNIPSSSIKDCHRLGKFSPSNGRSRPVLVRFNSCSVVMQIFANRSSFAPYVVKPDLSPAERSRERILLKERWTLYQSGVDKSAINSEEIH